MTAAVSRGTKPKLSVMPPVVVFDEILLEIVTPAIGEKPAETHFYTPQAVYGIHPTTEERVMAHLEATTPRPKCHKAVNVDEGDPCVLDRGHDGDCEGLPF